MSQRPSQTAGVPGNDDAIAGAADPGDIPGIRVLAGAGSEGRAAGFAREPVSGSANLVAAAAGAAGSQLKGLRGDGQRQGTSRPARMITQPKARRRAGVRPRRTRRTSSQTTSTAVMRHETAR